MSSFLETVLQALDHENTAQRMSGWWFQTPEIRHCILEHWKQATIIWEQSGCFPEQAARCRQMMLLHDGEDGGEDEKKPAVAHMETAAQERARYLEQYEAFQKNHMIIKRKRRHQQQSFRDSAVTATEEQKEDDTRKMMFLESYDWLQK